MEKVIDGDIGHELLDKVTANAQIGLVGLCWMDAGARSVVDGAENNPPSFVFDNHYQVAKHFTLTEHLIIPEILVFSRRSWDGLAADDQALIKKFGGEAQLEERALWKKKEQDAFDKMKAANIDIIRVADKTPFQNAVKPIWDKYGAQYAELIKRIQAAQ
jgi:TRAP-type C4-dicarboxylate transport system substrate-binding protein